MLKSTASYNSKRYIIFLDLPKNIQGKIDLVKKKYSPNGFKKWPSHITFKYDEDYLLSQEEIIDMVKNFFSKITVLKLTLDKPVISFLKQTGGWNICIPVKNETTLKKIVRTFSKKVELFIDLKSPETLVSTKWEQSRDFSPHISIKGGLGRVPGQTLYKEVLKENFHIDFPINIECYSVTLAKWKNKKWGKVCRIKLHNKNTDA